MKVPAYFKRDEEPPSFKDIVTNRLKYFGGCGVHEISLSGLHKLTFAALETFFSKQKLKMIKYKNY